MPFGDHLHEETRLPVETDILYDVIIIGAGISGIAAACQLSKKINGCRLRVFELQSDLGGVWRSHRYPGVACDVPAPLYSYSFSPNGNWSSLNPSGIEILQYFCRMCETFRVRERIQFNTLVNQLRWDEGNKLWQASIVEHHANGERHSSTIRSRAVISAAGKFNEPKESALDGIPGAQTFKGTILHTARWEDHVSLKEKDVLIIGTGCSAAQLVPELLSDSISVKSVTQVMKSPPWVAPRPLSENSLIQEQHILWMLRHLPILAQIVRLVMFAVAETNYFLIFKDNALCRLFQSIKRRALLEYMRRNVPDHYHSTLTPHYEVGCKRLVQDAGWFQSLRSPRVNLTTSQIKRIEPEAVILSDDGSEETRVAADAIILATGYKTSSLLQHISIFGRDAVSLQDVWAQRGGAQAYLGVAMDKFPNLFFVFGPNSSVGHTSVLIGIESSISYIVKLIKRLTDGEVRVIEVKEEACRSWTSRIQRASRRSVWMAGGCRNWYVDDNGWNAMVYPFSQIYAMYTFAFPRWKDWEVKYNRPRPSQGCRVQLFSLLAALPILLLVIWFCIETQ